MEEEGQTSLKAVRLDIEKLVRLHSLAMSEFAWNRVVSRQLPFGVIGVFFFFQGKSLIERYPSFLIIKINPPPLPRHFSPKSQLVSVWRRRGGGEGEGGGGSGVVRILSRNVLLMRFNTLLLKGLFPLRRRNSTMLQNVRES